MKKIFSILLAFTMLVILLTYCGIEVAAETADTASSEINPEEFITEEVLNDASVESQDSTALPAVEHLINFLFDGKVTLSQIIEYATIILATIFSFAYNKYKRKLLFKEKATSKTDLEIEELKAKDQDMANQIGLLGNMIVCAYLSNNLVDPELKKKLATYADELMKNTTINQDKLTEKLILAAQNPDFREKLTNVTNAIVQEAEERQEIIQEVQEDVSTLVELLNNPAPEVNQTQASEVIDNLKIGD